MKTQTKPLPKSKGTPGDKKPELGGIGKALVKSFDKLGAETELLITLYSKLGRVESFVNHFEPFRVLDQKFQDKEPGPIKGGSEQVNWLKGFCDAVGLLSKCA